ncbi:MAG TPA: acetate/propionate family kinase, partial [Planctomycetaceae bacterium]|nr:acetate/propionate family kinase [Planctomycetaceae bacterium]
SSSVKFALFHMGQTESLVLSGRMERIGLSAGVFKAKGADGATLVERPLDLPDHAAAFKGLFAWLQDQTAAKNLEAIGHRIVHGGSKHTHPQRITPQLVASLRELIPWAPDHLPHEIDAIELVSQSYPSLAQVACFDTAFHSDMPRLAKIFALPRHFDDEGVRRYGFHGLSYEYILGELRNKVGAEAADGRVVMAHLGNGSSLAAVRDGKCLDTTMGFTPTGGLVMSTRSGDLDPGIILYLLREKGLTLAEVDSLVNQQAGLLGVSGTSSDMADLLAREAADPHAAEAVALFCRQAKKFLASFAGVLGGLDTLIFTAGIGENAPSVRWRICQDLAFLGVHIDADRNDASDPIISTDDSRVTVRVMKTNEELMIARHTRSVIHGKIADGTNPSFSGTG